jgi:hypothetical protein
MLQKLVHIKNSAIPLWVRVLAIYLIVFGVVEIISFFAPIRNLIWTYIRFILRIPVSTMEFFLHPSAVKSGFGTFQLALWLTLFFSAVGLKIGRKKHSDDLINTSFTFMILAILGIILFWSFLFFLSLLVPT